MKINLPYVKKKTDEKVLPRIHSPVPPTIYSIPTEEGEDEASGPIVSPDEYCHHLGSLHRTHDLPDDVATSICASPSHKRAGVGCRGQQKPDQCDGRGTAERLTIMSGRWLLRAQVQLFEDITWDDDAFCALKLAERVLARVVGVESHIIAHVRPWSRSMLLVCVIRR